MIWFRQPRVLLPLYNGVVALGALLALVGVLETQSQTRDAVLLGYSLERLLLGSILFLIALGLLYLAIRFARNPEQSKGVWDRIAEDRALYNKILWGNTILLLVCWLAIFFPSYRITGNLSEYITQLRPVLVWLAAVAVVTFLFLLPARGNESLWEIVSANKTALRMGGIMLAAFLFIWILIAWTGIGVLHREDYWYGPGVPVLGLQVLFSFLLGAAALWLESLRSIKDGRKLDALICVAIWIITAWLWAREPLSPNYFMPNTGNNFIYPFSDSATFDIPSQYALIGQGLFNGQYFDRALYSAYLTYLHTFVGQETETLMVVQAVLFAVFPVFVYLIGRELHSRALGLSAAVLILLRGVNAIAVATWIDLAGPKMMLTDFPTAIGIALFVLFLLKWLNDPSNARLLVWAGGALGMTLMLRTHVVLLAPILLIYFLLPGLRLRWNHRGIAALALILGMIAATTPWDLRNLSNGTPMFYAYYFRIQVILRERYGIQDDAHVPSPPAVTAGRNVHQRIAGGRGFSGQVSNPLALDNCDSQACSIVNHFFHNLTTSALFLPSTLTFDSLWNTVKEGEPYWSQHWIGGDISREAGLLLAVNLAVVALGIGAAWERKRMIGLIPLLIFFAYLATNALGFTSGGRYIVPVDWIVCLYFILGLLQIAFWLLRRVDAIPRGLFEAADSKADVRPIRYSGVLTALGIMFVIGALVPLAEMPFQERYPVKQPQEMLAMLEERGLLEQANLDITALSEFLSGPQAVITEGRALYPRYYLSGEGESKRSYPYLRLDYPRQAFLIIGPYGALPESVVVSGNRIRADLHAFDVIVIGCREEQFLDALVVFVLSDSDHIHFRSPLMDWTCPLLQPVEPAEGW